MTDVLALRSVLDGEHAAVRDRVRAYLQRPEFLPVDELSKEDHRARITEQVRTLGQDGATSLGFPSEYGGSDDVAGSLVALETIAHGDLSLMVKAGVQFGLFGGAIHRLGTKKHHDLYLRPLMSLELPGCYGMTETGHGSNVAHLETTATYDPVTQEFLIDTPTTQARKDYIGNAARDGIIAVVFAQLVVQGTSRGVHALVVPVRDPETKEPLPGVTIEDCGLKMGLNGVDNGRLHFDGVRIPRDNLLDRYAQVTPEGHYVSDIESDGKRFFTMLGTLIQGRICIAGASNSAAKNALAIAVRHAVRRRQFGPPDGEEIVVMDYLTHQRRLLPRIANTYALHAAQQVLVRDLAEKMDDETLDRRKLEAQAAGMKALASWHARDTIQVCRECCGGFGFLAENRFAALKGDTDVFSTFEGDNVVLLQLVGKSLLTEYQHDFADLDPIGAARFVASQVIETVVEKSAVRELVGRLADDLIPGRDEFEDLLHHDVQVGLLEWRAEHILGSLGRRLRSGMDAGHDPFDVFQACQDHVVTAGRVEIEAHVLRCFVEWIRTIEDESIRQVLHRLCDLHALSTIEGDRGWFQEHGRLSSTRSKAVQKAVNQLCRDLRPDVEALVDGFGIPDAVLAAPIAFAPKS